ncbi:MAG: hypothetical protein KAI66_04980 [Lentisphaeria bacterium]|nr:hypothetical protein [Lentisphaeria bacterium]
MDTFKHSLILGVVAGLVVLAGCNTPATGGTNAPPTRQATKQEASRLTPEQENVLVNIQYFERCIVELRKEAKSLQRIKDFRGASLKLDKAAKFEKSLEEMRRNAPKVE